MMASQILSFRNRTADPMKRFGLLSTLFAAFIVGCTEPSSWPSETFDSDAWASADESQRYVYAKDLLDGKLDGLKRAEVRALLGRPSSEGGELLIYVVKQTPGEDEYYIYIGFDPATGKVVRSGVSFSD